MKVYSDLKTRFRNLYNYLQHNAKYLSTTVQCRIINSMNKNVETWLIKRTRHSLIKRTRHRLIKRTSPTVGSP